MEQVRRMSANGPNGNRLPFSIDNILREDFGPNRPQLTTAPRYYNPVGFYVGIPVWYYHRYWPRAQLSAQPYWNQRLLNVAGEDDSQQITDDSLDRIKDNEQEKHSDNTDLESASDSDESVKITSIGKRKYDDEADAQEEPKKKRSRVQFTEMQLKYLENYFQSNRSYLSRDERTVLAQALGITELQIRNWFQNKRYQMKHKESQTTLTPTSTTTTTTSTTPNVERTEIPTSS